jgi:hypothetical protein
MIDYKPATNDPFEMLVLHWNEATKTWDRISWDDWSHFRALRGRDEFRPLQNVRRGDHFFVCIAADERTVFNIIPHRYRVDGDGRIVDHDFDDLSPEEGEIIRKWQHSHFSPEGEEAIEYNALRERCYRSWLPPREAAMALIRDLPGFPVDGEIPFITAFVTLGSEKPPKDGRSAN